jgi:hypothetical protein
MYSAGLQRLSGNYRSSSCGSFLLCAELDCEELEWGSEVHLQHIKDSYPGGFDLILGADIYILSFNQILSQPYLVCSGLWVTSRLHLHVEYPHLHIVSCSWKITTKSCFPLLSIAERSVEK